MITKNSVWSFICGSFTEASNVKDALDREYHGRFITSVAGRILFVADTQETAIAVKSDRADSIVQKVHDSLNGGLSTANGPFMR